MNVCILIWRARQWNSRRGRLVPRRVKVIGYYGPLRWFILSLQPVSRLFCFGRKRVKLMRLELEGGQG